MILSDEQTSEQRGQTGNSMVQKYFTKTLHQQSATRVVIHNQPKAGNASFRGVRSIS